MSEFAPATAFEEGDIFHKNICGVVKFRQSELCANVGEQFDIVHGNRAGGVGLAGVCGARRIGESAVAFLRH